MKDSCYDDVSHVSVGMEEMTSCSCREGQCMTEGGGLCGISVSNWQAELYLTDGVYKQTHIDLEEAFFTFGLFRR